MNLSSILLILYLGLGTSLYSQKRTPLLLVSYESKDHQKITEYYKELAASFSSEQTKCLTRGRGSFCSEGVILNQIYAYKGPFYKNTDSNYALTAENDGQAFEGLILFNNGLFFKGSFVKTGRGVPTRPIFGFLLIDSQTYYYGNVDGAINQTDVERFIPNGIGRMYHNKCNGATILEGNWENGEIIGNAKITNLPLQNITLLDPAFCNSQKNDLVFLEESIKQKKEELNGLSYQKAIIENEIKEKKATLTEVRNEIQSARNELSLTQQDQRFADIGAIRELLRHYQSIGDLLDNSNLRPSLSEFQALFYRQDSQMNTDYDVNLRRHIRTVDWSNYSMSNYFIRAMSLSSFSSLWFGNPTPRFNARTLGLNTNFIVVSFFNSRTFETYSVFFYKTQGNRFKIIQVQII